MVIFPVYFAYIYVVGQLVAHPPSRTVSFSIEKLPDVYTLIPIIRPLALSSERILILELIRTLPTFAIYDAAHFSLLGGVDRDFPFTED